MIFLNEHIDIDFHDDDFTSMLTTIIFIMNVIIPSSKFNNKIVLVQHENNLCGNK